MAVTFEQKQINKIATDLTLEFDISLEHFTYRTDLPRWDHLQPEIMKGVRKEAHRSGFTAPQIAFAILTILQAFDNPPPDLTPSG